MINSLLFFITLYLFSLNFSDKTNWPKTAFYVLALSSAFIYFSSLLDFYSSSQVVLISVAIAGAVFAIRKRAAVVPGPAEWFALFFILVAVIIPYKYNFQLHLWDEFSHWGTVQKVFKITRNLSVDISHDVGASYIQGLSIWIDLLSSGNALNEYSFYSASACFLLVFFFLTVFLLFSEYFKEDSIKILPLTLITCCFLWLCILTEDSAYTLFTLYVDFPLAVFITGAALSLLVKEIRASFSLLFCSCLLLTLTKHIGFFFSFIFIILWALTHFRREQIRILFRSVFIVFLTIVVCKYAWDWHLVKNNIPKYFNENKLPLNSLFLLPLTLKTDSLFIEILNKTLVSLKENYLVFYSILGMILASTLHFIHHRRMPWIYVFSFVVSVGGYFLLLLLSYRFLFTNYEAARIASFSRYINTMLFAWCIFPTAWLLVEGRKYIFMITRFKLFTYSIAIALILLIFSKLDVHRAIADHPIEVRKPIRTLAEKVKEKVGHKARIFLIWQHSDGYHYHISRYEFYPNKIDNDVWSFGQPFSEKDVWTHNLPVDELVHKIRNYQYVLVASEEGSLWQDYGFLFDKQELGLFKVISFPDKSIKLESIPF